MPGGSDPRAPGLNFRHAIEVPSAARDRDARVPEAGRRGASTTEAAASTRRGAGPLRPLAPFVRFLPGEGARGRSRPARFERLPPGDDRRAGESHQMAAGVTMTNPGTAPFAAQAGPGVCSCSPRWRRRVRGRRTGRSSSFPRSASPSPRTRTPETPRPSAGSRCARRCCRSSRSKARSRYRQDSFAGGDAQGAPVAGDRVGSGSRRSRRCTRAVASAGTARRSTTPAPCPSRTRPTQKMGVHLGGGVDMPIAPQARPRPERSLHLHADRQQHVQSADDVQSRLLEPRARPRIQVLAPALPRGESHMKHRRIAALAAGLDTRRRARLGLWLLSGCNETATDAQAANGHRVRLGRGPYPAGDTNQRDARQHHLVRDRKRRRRLARDGDGERHDAERRE